jgi:ABC-type branched-subunit amino acid transport system substrate-binding protein
MIETIGACGTFGSGVKQIDGECVGVTDGSYVFLPELADVEQKIAQENTRVRQESSSYVTVAVLDPLASTPGIVLPPGMLRNRLEGAYTALRRVNAPAVGDPRPSIQLVLANQGSTRNQWQHVRDQLVAMTKQDNPLVAVIGLGVSSQQTEQQVNELSDRGIPMIGALLSADTLNYDRIPGLIRTSPSNQDYAAALGEYVDRTDLKSAVTVVDDNSSADLFIRTLGSDLRRRMSHLKNISTQHFVGTVVSGDVSPVLFASATDNICAERPDAVLYVGRPIDFSRFLESLESRPCVLDRLTVLAAGMDRGKVLEAQEDDLRAANLTVVLTATVNADGWRLNVPGTPPYYRNFVDFVAEFQRFGFDPGHLDEADAIMMHDALLTASQAVELAAGSGSPVTAGTVRDQVLNLNGQFAIRGASGTLSFSPESSGDPVGKPVPVLQYPPPSPGASRQVALYTVKR